MGCGSSHNRTMIPEPPIISQPNSPIRAPLSKLPSLDSDPGESWYCFKCNFTHVGENYHLLTCSRCSSSKKNTLASLLTAPLHGQGSFDALHGHLELELFENGELNFILRSTISTNFLIYAEAKEGEEEESGSVHSKGTWKRVMNEQDELKSKLQAISIIIDLNEFKDQGSPESLEQLPCPRDALTSQLTGTVLSTERILLNIGDQVFYFKLNKPEDEIKSLLQGVEPF